VEQVRANAAMAAERLRRRTAARSGAAAPIRPAIGGAR
jgi:hypothetical protein